MDKAKAIRTSGDIMSLSKGFRGFTRACTEYLGGISGRSLLSIALVFLSVAGSAAIISGTVYTREIFRNENGMRTWVAYSPDTGEQVSVIDAGESKYPGHSWRVMSADEYRHYKEHYENLIERNKDKYELAPPIARAEFESAEFLLADGETAITKPQIQTGTAYVVVLPQAARLINDPDTLVLAEYPFDPSQDHGVSENSLTMLINTNRDEGMGQIKEVSANRLAWQSAFLKDENGDPIPVQEGTATGIGTNNWSDKKPVGPAQWVGVNSIPFAADVTDENGKYVLVTVNDIYCPVPTEWFYSITAEFQYRRFNPKNRGGSRGLYFKDRTAYSYCTPLMVWVPWFGPLSSPGLSSSMGAEVIMNIDFPLDVSVLSGEAMFANPTSVRGDQVILSPAGASFFNKDSITSYKVEDPDNEKTITEGYDFDNDEELDTVKLGHYEFDEEDNKIFVEDAEINEEFDQFQAVWFSSAGKIPGEDLPDITRVLDSKSFLNFNHEGLLESINKEDVKNTDFYVVRVSDGRLIAERLGMHEQEERGGYTFGDNVDRGSFFYSQMLYGSAGQFGRPPGFSRKFEDVQSHAGINPELHERKADHLKPGDQIRIFAINRATGYMGSVDTYIRGSGENGDLSFPIEPILMGPPNLRIWAERNYEVKHGLTKGEIRENQIIGFEGASLNTDKFVAIHSRWLDHKGRPIPESLKGAGFTARLAVLSGDKELPDGNDGVHQFDIDPGQNLQVIQLSSNTDLENQHYYIHVSGEPSSGNPIFNGNETKRLGEVDFSSSGKNEGVLEKRPDYYVPFMVPLFDESNTEIQRQAYWEIQNDEEVADSDKEKMKTPDPIYRWVYRPEMQFTNYGLEVEGLNVYEDYDQDGAPDTDEAIDILGDGSPVLTPTDIVEMDYSLFLTDILPLDYLNAGSAKDLILSLGEQEVEISIEGNQIKFENLEHLSLLTPEDFFSIRLYENGDMGNALWEFAFEYLDIHPMVDVDDSRDENNVILVSADNPEVPVEANLVGYANRIEKNKYDVEINWMVNDPGRLSHYVDSDRDYAIFQNTIFMSTRSGKEYELNARLLKDDGETVSESLFFKVVPGKPTSIEASVEGKSHVNAIGTSTLTFIVKDAHGNLVSDDTPIRIATSGSVELAGSSAEVKIRDGRVQVDVVGSEYAETGTVTLTAGDIKEQVPVEILPLQIAIEDFPGRVGVNTEHKGLIRVLDSDGGAVSGLSVNAYSLQGRVANRDLTTDANGEVEFTYVAPQRSGEGVIKATVGFQEAAEHSFAIRYPSGAEPRLDTYRAFMVGDKEASGVYEYTRYDGAPLSITYEVTGQIIVRGQSGDDVTAVIGSHYKPNRQMLSALWMNDIESGGYPYQIKDQVGYIDWTNNGVTVNDDGPVPGKGSYYFDQDHIYSTSAEQLKRPNSIGASLAIKPEAMQGELINLAGGLTLRLLENGQLSLSIKPENSEVKTVLSQPVGSGAWHEVAVHFHEGRLELAVDGEVYAKEVQGGLEFGAVVIEGGASSGSSNYDVVVGRDFKGSIAGLSWYALDSSPLVTFPDGTEETEISMSSAGQATVPIVSTGNMRGFNSALPMQNVGFSAENDKGVIRLISKELFEGISRVAVAGQLVGSAPPVNNSGAADLYLANIENGIVFPEDIVFGNRSSLIPKAYAYEISFWDVASIISSLVGLDSIEVIWDQMGNMIAGRDVDIVAFSIAVLDLLTLFPPAWPLKAVMAPAKAAVAMIKVANPKAARYLGGVIKRLYDRAKDRDFSLVFQGIAFFIVSAEMMTDPDSREGLKVMASTIDSTEDFLSWVEFFSLLDPEADPATSEEESAFYMGEGERAFSGNVGSILPPAYAAVNISKAIPLGRILKEIGPLIKSAGDDAAATIRSFTRIAKEGGDAAKKLRRYATRKGVLKGVFGIVKRGGLIKLRTWLLGYNGQRISPLALLVIVGYLEDHYDDDIDPLFARGLTEYEESRNRKALNHLYAEAVPSLAPGSSKYAAVSIAKAHGASYHLAQLAYLHATSLNILGIEVQRDIPVIGDKKEVALLKVGESVDWGSAHLYRRRVDIVTGAEFYKDESWWELKSWKAKSKSNRVPAMSIRPWTFLENRKQDGVEVVAQYEDGDADAKGEAHKQFSLDRIAKKLGAYPSGVEAKANGNDIEEGDPPIIKSIDGVAWNFHNFTAGKSRNIVSPQKNKLETVLVIDPRGGKLFKGQSANDGYAKSMINVSATQKLLEVLQQKGRDMAEEALSDLPDLND